VAFEIENTLVAGLRYNGATDTILAQFGIASVQKTGAGNYLVTTVEGIDGHESTTACAAEPPNPAVPADVSINHTQETVTTHRLILASPPSNGGADTIVSFKVYRAHTLGD
jgi:hypothetical protein